MLMLNDLSLDIADYLAVSFGSVLCLDREAIVVSNVGWLSVCVSDMHWWGRCWEWRPEWCRWVFCGERQALHCPRGWWACGNGIWGATVLRHSAKATQKEAERLEILAQANQPFQVENTKLASRKFWKFCWIKSLPEWAKLCRKIGCKYHGIAMMGSGSKSGMGRKDDEKEKLPGSWASLCLWILTLDKK